MKVWGRTGRILGVALALFAGVFAVAPVFEASAAEERPDYRIQVTPSQMELDLEPGATKTEKFEVQNTGAKELKFEVSVAPYSVSGEDYATDFSTETKYTDLAKWVTFSEKEGTVEPNDSKEITATVRVPEDVPAGGQYAVILARIVGGEGSDADTGVSVVRQVGIVMYSNIEGETRKDSSVIENKISSFLFEPPISATSVVENKGNVHVEASYVLQVSSLFGGEEVYTNEENPEKRMILPETRRYNQISWEGAPQLGLFKVKQTVTVLDQKSVEEKVVFICPVWFMFIVILIIFCVVFWIISRVRGRNKV